MASSSATTISLRPRPDQVPRKRAAAARRRGSKQHETKMGRRAVSSVSSVAPSLPDETAAVAVMSAGEKRSSRADSYSSCESVIVTQVVPPPPRAATAARAAPPPPPPSAGSRSVIELYSPPPRRKFTPPSCLLMSPVTQVAMSTQIQRRSSIVSGTHSSSTVTNSHYPRLYSLYGQRVYQHQQVVIAPARSLYPAPLSGALLYTLYHPAWLRPKEAGADEQRAIQQHGHAHFMLPARMNRMETMMERCLQALEGTSMPLPPLQPLLPSPCPIVNGVGTSYSDPLTDVLDSLPPTPAQPYIFSTHRVVTAPDARYTTAWESARNHIAMKSDDRKWWEVRTFPSFDALRSPGPTVAARAFVRPDSAVYAMADRSKRIHASKCTYVTSQKPIFTVQESWSSMQLLQQQQRRAYSAISAYSTPPPSAVTTPTSSSRAGGYGIQQQQCQGRRFATSPYHHAAPPDPDNPDPPDQPYPPTPTPPPLPPTPSPPLPPTAEDKDTAADDCSSSSSAMDILTALLMDTPQPSPMKRPAVEKTPEVMKRARRSLYEACAAARSKEAAERAYLGLQPLRQLHQQQQHDLYLLEQMKQEQQHPQLLLVEDWINGNDVVQSESDYSILSSRPEVITVEEDGTTFTVL